MDIFGVRTLNEPGVRKPGVPLPLQAAFRDRLPHFMDEEVGVGKAVFMALPRLEISKGHSAFAFRAQSFPNTL